MYLYDILCIYLCTQISKSKTEPFINFDMWTKAAVASFFHVHLPLSDPALSNKATV